MTLCACGEPLHYSAPDVQVAVEDLVARLGPDVKIVVEGRAWMVPRHYIALHGIRGADLPMLATRLGFVEVLETNVSGG